eukprot:5872319-Pleurochrysis_carterae.AAC.2
MHARIQTGCDQGRRLHPAATGARHARTHAYARALAPPTLAPCALAGASWPGIVKDPTSDGAFHINKGLRLARELLLQECAPTHPALPIP